MKTFTKNEVEQTINDMISLLKRELSYSSKISPEANTPTWFSSMMAGLTMLQARAERGEHLL